MFDKRDQKGKIITRKIQKTGGSSYVITLPKDWLNSIKTGGNDGDDELKGIELGIILQPDNTLLITPNLSRETLQRKKVIELTPGTDSSYLFRYLVSSYITGFTSIEVRGSIIPALRMVVRKFIQMVIGFEILEEEESCLSLKDLLNPAEMPFENIIKQMSLIAKKMHMEAIQALKEANIHLASEISERDDDIDRLYWLVARQTNMMLRDSNLEEKLGITADLAANMFLISRIIERIGDHAVRIAENVIILQDQVIDGEIIQRLETVSEIALAAFDRSIEALIEGNMLKANENIESVKEFEKKCEEITPLARKQESRVAISVDNIIESIRRIGEYAEDISENVMNILAREDDEF
ncbi:MAG: PhoU domain-containing protein [Candidatus Odinarchaeota archaeon]